MYKILVLILILSIVHIIKEIGRFWVAFKTNAQYESKNIRTLLTMLAISYITTIIICGF
jgi:hypothetical protein